MFRSYQVTFSRAAQRALSDHVVYLASQGVSAQRANTIAETIRKRARSLCRFPYRHREGQEENTREFALPGGDWVLVYRVDEDKRLVQILTLESARMRI